MGRANWDNIPDDQYDSSVYPKGPYANGGGEADYPQHCDDCGVFLENPLTTDGYEYVLEYVEKYPKDTGGLADQWAEFYAVAS